MKNLGIRVFLLLLLAVSLAGQQVDVYSRPLQSERSRDFDVFHYRIRLNLDIIGRAFQGETTITLASLRDGLARISLDSEEFTVSRVRDAWGKALRFEQPQSGLSVEPARPLLRGETFTFTVTYAGRDPENGLRFYEETPNRPALVASDSFPDRVRHWFPCYDFPNDKVTEEVIITVPAGNKAVSNGRLVSVSENLEDGTVTWHWSQERPHSTYLIFLAAAPYVVVRDRLGTVPINYWVYPQHAEHARRTFGKTPEMMAYFNDLFDFDYPWAKYDQVEVPFGGGAESTSATAMGERVVIDERAEPDYPSIGIVSHELAHHWWGDLITLRTWSQVWMNESFGTYCDYLYARYELGEDEGAVNLLDKKNSYLREARTRYMRPIVFDRYQRPEQVFDAHSYPKGANVLHMLRFILGDEAFFRTLSRFLHDFAFQPVDTHDFMKTVKTVTGRNLDGFFDQWLYKPGHPVFEVESAWDRENRAVRLRVRQVQDFDKGIPVFRMPVRIAVVTESGRALHSVRIEQRDQTFTFETAEQPLLVRFDDGNFLLKEWTFEKSLDELIYQLSNDDVIGRMWAAGELLRYRGRPRTREALLAAAAQDTFWAVRRSAVEALGKLGDPALIEPLQRAGRDTNSRVRAAAVAALGDFARPGLVDFFKTVFREDRSYVVQAEALRSIGKSAGSDEAPFLESAAGAPSHRDVVRKAAEAALESLHKRH